MWEERTCRQVRQWQHWGSGCYQYTCQSGRLHIIVCLQLIIKFTFVCVSVCVIIIVFQSIQLSCIRWTTEHSPVTTQDRN